MDSCANTCARKPAASPSVRPELTQAAETLAGLMTGVPEFQDFLRLARAVHADKEVNGILSEMDGCYGLDVTEENTLAELENQLAALPIMREYRQAEQAARVIFAEIENLISGSAGVAFAEHARLSACS